MNGAIIACNRKYNCTALRQQDSCQSRDVLVVCISIEIGVNVVSTVNVDTKDFGYGVPVTRHLEFDLQ